MGGYKAVDTGMLEGQLTKIADAIREKTGDAAKLSLDDMIEAVRKLPGLIVTSAAGNSIALGNGAEQEFRGLRLFGKTTQNGTPSPNAPVPLVSAGDGGSLGVTVAGKNLLANNVTSGTINGVTFTVNADGSVTMNGTATADVSFPIFGNNWNDTSKKLILDGNIDYILSKGTANAVVYARDAISNRNFETPLNSYRIIEKVDSLTYVYIRILKGKTLNNETIYPMIRLASIADGIYEPYKQSQTLNLSTPNGLPGIPVTSSGNYTDETGQQWVCDEVDFGRGIYVQRIFGTVFKSAVGWNIAGTKNGLKRFYTNQFMGVIKNAKDEATKECALCSHFINVTASDTWNEVTGISVNSKGRLDIFYSGIEQTTAALDVYFSSNPVAFMAELATPIETPLSTEELAAYAALHTNYPNTTILNDGGAGMEVKYVADTKNYIDNQIAAVAATIVNA